MKEKPYFCHPLGLAESDRIGEGTRIWAWAHVMKGATLGRDCNVGEHCFVEQGAVIGDQVVIKNGVAVWDGVTLEDRVFVGPNAVFTNDLVPRAKVFTPSVKTLVRQGASIGANATIVCGNEIGAYAFIAAGAVVTRPVPPHALMMGVPARVAGFVCRCGQRLKSVKGAATCSCGLSYRKEREGMSLVDSVQPKKPARRSK